MSHVALSRGKNESRVRAPRFQTIGKLTVDSRTIGTEIAFRMATENLSRSGMLLRWTSRSPLPFLVNTILELEIDQTGAFLGRSVHCLAKVVRRLEGASASDLPAPTDLGVQIVQIDDDDLRLWDACIDRLESAAESRGNI